MWKIVKVFYIMPCSGLITVLPLLEDIRDDADFYESCGWILAVNRYRPTPSLFFTREQINYILKRIYDPITTDYMKLIALSIQTGIEL